jgi:hypothetical protein
MPLIARLRDEQKVIVQTLAESGQWFRDHYKITPATSVTVNTDIKGSNLKTVWFNSRFFRINLLWENATLRIRDIHLFNEDFPSVYTTAKASSNECSFFTLPFVDGYIWSRPKKIAGLRFKAIIDGKEQLLEGTDPTIISPAPGNLHITWPLKSMIGTLVIDIDEQEVKMKIEGDKPIDWFLDMTTSDNVKLPFLKINSAKIDCRVEGMNYNIRATKGLFSKPGDGVVFRITPVKNTLILNFSPSKIAN